MDNWVFAYVLHTQEVTGSSPAVSTRNRRIHKNSAVFFCFTLIMYIGHRISQA